MNRTVISAISSVIKAGASDTASESLFGNSKAGLYLFGATIVHSNADKVISHVAQELAKLPQNVDDENIRSHVAEILARMVLPFKSTQFVQSFEGLEDSFKLQVIRNGMTIALSDPSSIEKITKDLPSFKRGVSNAKKARATLLGLGAAGNVMRTAESTAKLKPANFKPGSSAIRSLAEALKDEGVDFYKDAQL